VWPFYFSVFLLIFLLNVLVLGHAAFWAVMRTELHINFKNKTFCASSELVNAEGEILHIYFAMV
jgi:hypothetical protein